MKTLCLGQFFLRPRYSLKTTEQRKSCESKQKYLSQVAFVKLLVGYGVTKTICYTYYQLINFVDKSEYIVRESLAI